MTKLVSPFPPVALLGGLCLLAWLAVATAQQPAAANVESAAADESKPDDANPGGDTEIYAMESATFTAKDRIAVFNGNVRVKDPRFTLACDKLTAFLAKGAVPGAEPSPKPAPTATPPPIATDAKSKDEDRPSGIDHALAEGHVIIIQKRAATKPGEEEKTTIARADRAEYDAKTGDMTLRGMPKVEQNGDFTEALSKATFMVIHHDNNMDVYGPHLTHIVQRAKSANTPGSKPAASPAASRRPSATP